MQEINSLDQYNVFVKNASPHNMAAWFEAGDYTLMACCRSAVQDHLDSCKVDTETLDMIHKMDQKITQNLTEQQLLQLEEEFGNLGVQNWWGSK